MPLPFAAFLPLIATGLTAGASAWDSHRQQRTSRYNTDATIAANKAEAELSWQRNLQMWEMQNRYNTPEAQMKRYQDAGLNPHLIYGQGNSGNAQAPPNYQPPNIQYQYAAGKYGAAISSILPTLMSVGTWLQDMRRSEVEIKQKQTNTEKIEQLMAYLSEANPKLLSALDNKLSIFPYQRDAAAINAQKALVNLTDTEQRFRYNFGDDLYHRLYPGGYSGDVKQMGAMEIKRLQEQAKLRLLEAKSSWTDYNITDPQALMQLVLSGVMGLAGQTLRARPRINQGARQVSVHNYSINDRKVTKR